MNNEILRIPDIVIARHEELCNLVENRNQDGCRVAARELAEYYHVGVEYIRGMINTERIPYAFSNSATDRAVSYIGILPLFMWETQRHLLDFDFIMKGEKR